MVTSTQRGDGHPAPAWGPALAVAGLLWWLSNAAVVALRVPLESPSLQAQRLLADGAAIAGALGLTALFRLLLDDLRERFALPRALRGLAEVVALTLVFGVALLPDLTPFFERRRVAEDLGVEPLVALVALLLALALVLGVRGTLWLAARKRRSPRESRTLRTSRSLALLGFLGGIAAFAANNLLLRGDYPGIHLTIAAAACALVAVAVVLVLPGRRPGRLAWGLTAGIALLGVGLALREPPARVTIALARCEGAALHPFLGRLRPRPSVDTALLGDRDLWFSATRPSRPATAPPLLEGVPPLVVLVTVDALRADLLREHAHALPNLAALQREAVDFTVARANGTQTVSSLATLFAGTYYSQQYWSKGAPPETRAATGLFPHADPTPRFPELLDAAGVRTVNLASATWLVNSVGVVRGFAEEQVIQTPGENFAHARDLTDAVLRRLADPEPRPLFLYLHYLDPHSPYDRGEPLPEGEDPTPFARYLAEVALVDRELGG